MTSKDVEKNSKLDGLNAFKDLIKLREDKMNGFLSAWNIDKYLRALFKNYETINEWLEEENKHLSNRKPINLIRSGDLEELSLLKELVMEMCNR